MAKYLDSAGLGYFWSKLKALLAAKADAEEVAERVAGTQSGTTSAWTGVSAAGSLRDGKEILYYLPYAGSGSATLELTLSTGKTTGAKAVYRYGTTRVTTQYPAGSWVRLTYVAEKNGWYADADYDANTYDRVRWNNAITAASAVAANTLIGGTAEGYRTLTGGVSFDLGYPLLYATAAIAAGTTATTAYLTYPSAYTANNKSGFTGPVGRTVYLVGTVQGRRFTVDTSVFTASVPVEEDGRFYLPVGLLYSANRMYFCGGVSAQAYAFVDGAFRPASWDPTVPPWARAAEKPAYTKEEVGLGKVENKSSAEIRGELTKSDVTAALGYTPLQSVGAHTHAVSDIAQGDAATAGGLDPVTQGLIGSAASNKSFHLPAGAITVEYSTDGGAAWQDYGATDAQKVGLFSETRGTNFYLGKASAKAANTTACRLRVTIEPTDRYVSFNGVYLWISTSGSTVYMDLERSTIGAKETYTTVFTGQRLSGWSGNNIRYFPQGQFGGGATQTGNFYKYRLTLYQTAVNASYAAASVSDIRFLGVNVWNSPNNVVGTNRLYRWDTDLNATFPAQLTATAFNGPLNGKATSAGTADSAATAAKIAPFEKATASANRSVWFADSAAVNKPVYSDKFKYDPAADVLTVGSITGKAASADTLTGLTASVTELNYTKGVTSAIQTQLDGKAASSHTHNYAGSASAGGPATKIASQSATANAARPVFFAYSSGSTADTSQVVYNSNFQYNPSTKVLTVDSITGKAASADTLTGLTASVTELNHTKGVTSAIQTQLDGKAASSHTHTSVQVSDRLNVTGKGNYAWVSAANDDKLITSNTLAYWSGAYKGTSSNLTYCVKGAFGDLAAISKPTSNGTTTFLRGDGTWAVPAGTSYSNATQSAAGLMSADDKKIVDGIATTYLPKTTYEFNKEIAFGSSGKLCIGKFPCYDSNVTIEINATTNTTYHATAVLATQNINESHGGTITWNVYGDASNTIAPNLYLYYPSDSRYIEIYFSPSTYSKNLVHIQCQALRAAPTNVCESITAIPSTATTNPVNALGGYVKGLSVSGKVITYTKGDGTTGTISTQDTTYEAATQSAAGLMSAGDKKKLDGITIANYLPLSGGTLTGNLTGKYITGTWLQGTASNHATSKLDKVVVQDGSGWLYHRTLSEMKSDLGVAMPNGTANVGSGLLGVLDLIRYAWGGVDGVYTAEYVGTGTYGASNPCTIAEADLSREYETNGTSEYVGDALDGKSYRVVYAAVVYDTTDNGVLFLFPSFSAQDPTGRGFSITGSTITWATVTNFKYRKGAASYWPITWYSTSALRQMNVKDHQYRVLLLGFDRLQAMAWKAYTFFGRLQSDG